MKAMTKAKKGAPQKIKGTIVIDRELCKGCGYCINTCPKGSITIEKKFNSIGCFPAHFAHPEKCTGCAMCARMCPEIAIEVWREEG